HQQDFVAWRDRACLGARSQNRRFSGNWNLKIRGGCQKRESVARLLLNQRLEIVPWRGLRAVAASRLRLSMHRVKVPDMSECRRRSRAAAIDLGRAHRKSKGEQQNHNIAECLHREVPGYLNNHGAYNAGTNRYHASSMLSTDN